MCETMLYIHVKENVKCNFSAIGEDIDTQHCDL